jgi:catechol 2,3-dioxygenase-like lactoylglutathione lyase family enzyme
MFEQAQAFSSFSVNDIKRAAQFYRDVLGLSVDETPEGLALEFANGGKVFIYPKESHEPATFTVLNFPVPNIEAAVSELGKKGIEFEHYDDLPGLETDEKGIARGQGPTIAWFKDPAGNVLSVVQAETVPKTNSGSSKRDRTAA